MRRKVSKIGPATLMVSLPSTWVKKYKVRKGDELELTIKDNKITVSTTEAPKDEEKVTIDLSKFRETLRRFVGAIYKYGYNEIEILFEEHGQLEIIQKELEKTCIGFEIMEQGKNRVLIKNITEAEIGNFETVLRRVFMFLKTMADETEVALEENDKNGMRAVVLMDNNVNKLSDFCRRVLNKGEVNDIKKSNVLYHLSEQLERIGDIYKKMCSDALKQKAGNKQIALLRKANAFFNMFYEIFYKFDATKTENFKKAFKNLEKEISNSMRQTKNQQLSFRVAQLTEMIYELNGILLITNIPNLISPH